jgi:hypothetical protein
LNKHQPFSEGVSVSISSSDSISFLGCSNEEAFAASTDDSADGADNEDADDEDVEEEGEALKRLRLILVESLDSEEDESEEEDVEARGAEAAAAAGFGGAPINGSSAMRSLMAAMNATICSNQNIQEID